MVLNTTFQNELTQPLIYKPPAATKPVVKISDTAPTTAAVVPAAGNPNGIVQDASSPYFGLLTKAVPPAGSTAPTVVKPPTSGDLGLSQADANTGNPYGTDATGKQYTAAGGSYPKPATPPPANAAGGTDNGGVDLSQGYLGLKFPAPPVAPAAAPVADYGNLAPTYDPTGAANDLAQSLANIKAKYDIQRNDAATQTENERKSQISNLYGVGIVNPASSGVTSIGSASSDTLNDRMGKISAEEGAEVEQAKATSYNKGVAAKSAALAYAQDQTKAANDAAATKYANDRQAWQDSVSQINDTVNLYKAGTAVDKTQQTLAQTNIKNMLTLFGSQAFDGITADDLSNLEGAAGLPAGSLSSAVQTIKEKELTSSSKLKIVSRPDGIYSVQTDANGVATLVPLMKTNGGNKATKNYSSTTIPNDVKSSLLYDISKGMPKADAYSTYPEVDTKYLDTLYKSSGSSGRSV